jgi:hypothetical protein
LSGREGALSRKMGSNGTFVKTRKKGESPVQPEHAQLQFQVSSGMLSWKRVGLAWLL